MPWDRSTRRARLPKDWAARRAKVKARADGRCEAETHEPTCNRVGNECDHITPNDDHSMGNLQWLSVPCHLAKTLREAAAARDALRVTARRQPERHPGLKSEPSATL